VTISVPHRATPQGPTERDDSTLVSPAVAALRPYAFGPPWPEQARALGFDPDDFHLLAANENVLGPSPAATKAAGEALAGVHIYPDAGATALRERIAVRHDVPVDHVVVGNGSNEIIELLIRTFVQPNETIVTAWPSFVVYRLAAQAANREELIAPLRNHRYDLAGLAGLVDQRTKLVFIANPNNPTGTYVRKRELAAFLDRIPPHVIVVIDEAYYEYVTAHDFPDGMAALRSRPRVVVLRTFSKVFGLAAMRVGYGVMDPNLARYLHAVRQPFNVSSVAQAAARAALDDADHLEASQRLVGTELPWLMGKLQSLGVEPIPSQANFVCVRCPFDASELTEHLRVRGSFVRAMAGYDMPDCFRATVGTRAQNVRLIESIESYLEARGDGGGSASS
jgi:histidinol-phosphate aminotransferase